MQVVLFQKLRIAISADRLDSYRQAGNSDFDVLASYLWNVALCESLYPALQILEIALRNSIHAAATRRYGSEHWYDLPALHLESSQAENVAYAKSELTRKRKPLEASRIVAELTFGFWTGLLNSYYEQKLWPWMLQPCFPCIPRTIRKRHTLSARLNAIRTVRNRVFHHERISHWADLPQRHADILETIGWISPEWQSLLRALDRFPGVHKASAGRIREDLCRVFYQDDYTI